jgi:hypothetical protein
VAGSFHAGLAYAPVEHLEASIRYAGNGFRLGARYQILEQDKNGVDFTVGLGGARFSYEFPLTEYIPVLKVDDFVRWQLDVPVHVGKRGNWYRWWAGPKLLFTSFNSEVLFQKEELVTFEGKAGYLGVQGGVAFGYKYVFFGFELTVTQLIGSARGTLASSTKRETDLSTAIIYPSLGLMAEF